MKTSRSRAGQTPGASSCIDGFDARGLSCEAFERDAGPASRDQGYRIHLDEIATAALRHCLPNALFARFIAAAALLAPSVAWACSGPDAAGQIADAEQIGGLLFVLSLVIGGYAGWHALRPSVSRGLLGSMALLVIVHPGWWMSARGGDCGLTRIEASAVATALIVLLAAVLWWRARGRS